MSSSPLFKPFLLILFLLVSLHVFSDEARARSFRTPTSLAFPHTEVDLKVRRLIGVDALLLDYEPPGANPAHEPPKKGPPKGSNSSP